MLDEDPAVAADVEYMFKFRSTTEGVLAFSRDITCLLQQAKRSGDDQAFLDDILKIQKVVEDRCCQVSVIGSDRLGDQCLYVQPVSV